MSHLGTRLVALAFDDEDEGIDAVVEQLVSSGCLHGNDAGPSPGITIYDDTRHGWVARGVAPSEDQGIDFPCVRVMTMSVSYASGTPASQPTSARTVSGTLQVVAQLLLREQDTEDAASVGMYLLRAMRGVIAVFDHPQNYNDRVIGGIRLEPASSITQSKIDAPLGETIVSPGAFLITYPFTESVPLGL